MNLSSDWCGLKLCVIVLVGVHFLKETYVLINFEFFDTFIFPSRFPDLDMITTLYSGLQ